MSVAEVTSRISQIQAQLTMLRTGSTTSTGGTAFSGALDEATARTVSGTTSVAATDAGSQVVEHARAYLGVPYVWGGTDPAKGLDCSGLVQKVYSELGYDLPRVSYQQAGAGRAVASLAEAQPGDVLAFGSPVHHVGIYIGDNQMIHAPRPGQDVEVSSVYETPTAIRRILPDAGSTGVVAPVGGVSDSSRLAAGTPYAGLFASASARYGVSADLLSAVARQESGYNPQATSAAGAQGLMQLMPGTARGLGVTDSYDPAQAVDGAARLLKGLLDRFGSTDLALAAYNAGPGAVLKYDGVPPYTETRNYVRSVMSMLEAA